MCPMYMPKSPMDISLSRIDNHSAEYTTIPQNRQPFCGIDNHSAEWLLIGYIDIGHLFSFVPQCTTILRIFMQSGFYVKNGCTSGI